MAPARTHMLPSMQAWWSSVCKIGIYHHVFGHIHHDTHVYHHMFHCYVIKWLSPAKSGFCLKAAGFAASFSQNRSTSPGNNKLFQSHDIQTTEKNIFFGVPVSHLRFDAFILGLGDSIFQTRFWAQDRCGGTVLNVRHLRNKVSRLKLGNRLISWTFLTSFIYDRFIHTCFVRGIVWNMWICRLSMSISSGRLSQNSSLSSNIQCVPLLGRNTTIMSFAPNKGFMKSVMDFIHRVFCKRNSFQK